ncbi:putative leucine-rich repeat domain superfamily [Helianthus annuus]|nr:putative leucine-rich repeat domain superfamily [Helianthus annuus]
MPVDGSCVEIDHIIRHLSKKNTVKILKLDFNGSYRLPLSLFSFHQLTELYLNGCVLDLQPSSIGFGSLTTLNMQEIWTCDKTLLRLLSSCPLLKRLTINTDGGTIDESGDLTMADLFECLRGIEYLTVWCFIFLSFLPLPRKLPTTLVHLKHLCMECVCFCHIYALPIFVLLIRSSPNLEKLKLVVTEDEVLNESYMGSSTLEDYSDILLEYLNELEILHLRNIENGLVFVKLILAKSPVLKKVWIFLWDELPKDDKLQISEILLSCPCTSPMVKINVS